MRLTSVFVQITDWFKPVAVTWSKSLKVVFTQIEPPRFRFWFGPVVSHLDGRRFHTWNGLRVKAPVQGRCQTSWFLVIIVSFVAPSWTALCVCDALSSSSFFSCPERRSRFLNGHAEGLQHLQHVPPEEVTDG